MRAKVFKPVVWLIILVMATSLACNLGGSSAPTATVPPTPVEQPTQAALVAATSSPAEPTAAPVDEGLVTSLDGVESAVVLIEAEGSYTDPSEGWQLNVGRWGTGFIIDPSGIAVTNNHVVTGAALLRVHVKGEQGTRNARILGVSECSDLAVIDIDGDDFPYLKWYDGSFKAGTDVFVAGFPGSAVGAGYSLTKGIVSKPEASLDSVWASVGDVIEHSAKVNPGNSGGPLVNQEGQVFGVNYASVSDTDQNYAISRDEALSVIEQLRNGKDVDSIGVNGVAVSGTLNDNPVAGIWVRSVKSGSPADKARLQPGDIIIEMESQILVDATLKDYCSVLRTHNPGDTLSVTVIRSSTGDVYEGQLNGRELEYSHTLGAGQPGGTSSTGEYPNLNASQKGDIYYSTEFDEGMGDWAYFFTNGDDSGLVYGTDDSRLRVEENKRNIWVYFLYDKINMTDVRIDTKAENLGRNTNNISLICRESDKGWYEFNISNGGEYNILWYDDVVKDDYVTIFTGGSTLIKTGRNTNEYTAICKGNQLTLGVNGVEVKTVTDNNLKEGRAGLSVSSFDVLPIVIEFDYFMLTVP